MIDFTTIILLTWLIILISHVIGTYTYQKLNLRSSLPKTLIGFSVWMGMIFLVSFNLHIIGVSSTIFHNILNFLTIILIIISIKSYKPNFHFQNLIYIILYIGVLIYLSMNYGLGEKMGDSVFYFQNVSLNVNASIMNNFYFANGIRFSEVLITNDNFLSFYNFFSFILYDLYKFLNIIKLQSIPSYVYTMWLSNLLFYFFNATIMISVFETTKLKSRVSKILVLLVFLLFNTIYYNVTLPHIGNVFMLVFVSIWILLIHEYFQTQNEKILYLVLLVSYAIISSGNVGFIIVSIGSFASLFVSFKYNFKDTYKAIVLLTVPIVHYVLLLLYIYKYIVIIPEFIYLATIWIIILSMSFLGLRIKLIRNIQYIGRFITLKSMFYFMIILSFVSIVFLEFNFSKYSEFFSIQSNYDKVEDYFIFTKLNIYTLRNILIYISLIGLILSNGMKKMGLFTLFIMIFIFNPIVFPMIFDKISYLYFRSFIVIFNPVIISFGFISIFKKLDTQPVFKIITLILLSISLITVVVYQFSSRFNIIYEIDDEFNPLYKLENDQIGVLNKLLEIIKIEKYEAANVVSQIYGSLMYLENVNLMSFRIDQRRELWGRNDIPEIHQIFYSPIFPGDDGPRLQAPYIKTCDILIKDKVDFVIYDKSLSVYDENTNNWIPLHWYSRGCAEKVYENEKYILYRFYWKK